MYGYPEILDLLDLDQESDIIKLSDAESAYIAGIIDGEGSFISVQRSDRDGIRISCRIETIDDKIIPYISNITGIPYKQYTKEINYKYYCLSIHGNNLILLLTKVIPYLILKKQQAILTINLLYLMKHSKSGTNGYRFAPELQNLIHDEIRKLNKVYKTRKEI